MTEGKRKLKLMKKDNEKHEIKGTRRKKNEQAEKKMKTKENK